MKKLQGINHIVTKRSGSVWVGNMIQSWCSDVSFTKFENVYPITFHNAAQSGVIILQTRDLLNWYASYITVKKGKKLGPTRIIQSWFAVATEFYKPFYLKEYTVVRVMYEDFFKNRDYRKDICAQLGGVYSEEKLQEMSIGSDGSSFTKMEMDGDTQSMPVLERYKMINPVLYKRLFQAHPYLLEFYRKNMMGKEKRRFLISIGVIK